MAGDMDPRLVDLLRASLGLVDALRDIGVEGEIGVNLDRAGALRLLELVDARGKTGVGIAGLTFTWPKDEPLQAFAENDNGGLRFDGETPALR